ncbi:MULTISPECIES: hypothetical protein [unclassified Rhodococcus (in: high G+C Gram-positive bacteria)]|nr:MULTISPECIES: hypothetical protein [unclassified Rhodococcus (in: high G+C Gram-positive bacteria)]MBC2641974.1 hypothetical protein [Rhodococcus sp. 3A]MBC2893285.1 hypothetical protein [Rhodococcus sp. 4CII]
MRTDDRRRSKTDDYITDDAVLSGEPVLWPDPSPLTKWWQQILFGERRST